MDYEPRCTPVKHFDDGELYEVDDISVKVIWGYATGINTGCHNVFDKEICVYVDDKPFTGFNMNMGIWDDAFEEAFAQTVDEIIDDIRADYKHDPKDFIV